MTILDGVFTEFSRIVGGLVASLDRDYRMRLFKSSTSRWQAGTRDGQG